MERILIVAPNWIGDALMAQPLLMRLRKKHPVGAPTVIPTHGANPGLISHWVKQGLINLSRDIRKFLGVANLRDYRTAREGFAWSDAAAAVEGQVPGDLNLAVAAGVRAEICTTPVASLIRSVTAARYASGVSASAP
mgnify:CR=1 FL=1